MREGELRRRLPSLCFAESPPPPRCPPPPRADLPARTGTWRGRAAGGPRRGLARREEGGGVPPPPPLALRPRGARIRPAGQRCAARPRAEGEQARAGGMGSSRRHGEGGGRLRRAGQLRHARPSSGGPAPPRPVVSMASSMGGRSSRAGVGPLPRRRERESREGEKGGRAGAPKEEGGRERGGRRRGERRRSCSAREGGSQAGAGVGGEGRRRRPSRARLAMGGEYKRNKKKMKRK